MSKCGKFFAPTATTALVVVALGASAASARSFGGGFGGGHGFGGGRLGVSQLTGGRDGFGGRGFGGSGFGSRSFPARGFAGRGGGHAFAGRSFTRFADRGGNLPPRQTPTGGSSAKPPVVITWLHPPHWGVGSVDKPYQPSVPGVVTTLPIRQIPVVNPTNNPNSGSVASGLLPTYGGLNFVGFSCLLGHSTGGGDHIIAITGQTSDPGTGSDKITVTWQGENPKNPNGGPVKTVSGAITPGRNGSYTITFSWTDGSDDTNTYTGTLSPQGGGSWYLSGEVTVTDPKTGQVVPGMGPGISSCLYVSQGNSIPQG